MKIGPPHLAVLAYVEWCIAQRRPWPKLYQVAADACQHKREIERAFAQLQEWGALSCRYAGDGHRLIVRLADGRETISPISYISTGAMRLTTSIESRANQTRIAA